jgi:hypothetical protein
MPLISSQIVFSTGEATAKVPSDCAVTKLLICMLAPSAGALAFRGAFGFVLMTNASLSVGIVSVLSSGGSSRSRFEAEHTAMPKRPSRRTDFGANSDP